jgi:membrane-associated phospholipid phosphatase
MTVVDTADTTNVRSSDKSIRWLVLVLAGAVAVVVAVTSAVGLLLTHGLDGSPIVAFDRRVAHGLVDHRTALGDRLTGWGTVPSDPIPVALMWLLAMVATYAILRRRGPVLFLLFAVGGEKTSYFLSTLIVRRPRPDVVTIGERHVTSSFPSGHVGSAVSLYGAIATLLVVHAARRGRPATALAVTLVSILSTVVAVCRMYRGFHFLSDVVAGAIVGAAWIVISGRVVRRFEPVADRPGAL